MNEATVFAEALKLPDTRERAAYLKRMCKGDASLLARITGLLQMHERAGHFMEVPAVMDVTLDAETAPSLNEGPGTSTIRDCPGGTWAWRGRPARRPNKRRPRAADLPHSRRKTRVIRSSTSRLLSGTCGSSASADHTPTLHPQMVAAERAPGMLSGPMTNTEHPDRLVLHIAGADRTGVTARLTEIIAQEGAALINIGQSVLNGYLMLSAIVDLPKNSYALRKILFAAADMGLRIPEQVMLQATRVVR